MGNGATDTATFKSVFRITAIIDFIYGLGFLLMPAMQFQMSQDPGIPANPSWVRWAGGVLIGLAAGAWFASGSPAKQRPLVTSICIGHALTALSLTYATLSGEYRGVAWYIWSPVVLTGAIAAAMYWLLNKYRAVL
jgi:hypothetical protein